MPLPLFTRESLSASFSTFGVPASIAAIQGGFWPLHEEFALPDVATMTADLEACFPAGPWKQFERTRPPKLRGRAARELGLPGLDMGAKEKSPQGPAKALPAAVKARAPAPRATGQKTLF